MQNNKAGRSGQTSASRARRPKKKKKRSISIILIAGLAFMAVLSIIGIKKHIDLMDKGNGDNNARTAHVSDDVLFYEDVIIEYAEEYGISDFVPVIEAVMQQESGGKGLDVMQCSECMFNYDYPQEPGGITDPYYSVRTGVRYLAYCLSEAGCDSLADLNGIKLALQGYNFGHNYIHWAIENGGGYSESNAREYSQILAKQFGWDTYGDPLYVEHVLRYYN
ncbi:MAG: lysozyme family protein [Lachnospiraceae bacterium]|nr:lysozyme family protein [Lachnospiraceae bacterium]